MLGVFLFIVFGMLDLGLLVLEYNTLSEAARRLARVAIVRGQMSAPQLTAWGPDHYGKRGRRHGIRYYLKQELVTFNLSQVNYSLQWLDATNQPGYRVQITLTYQYQPIVPYVLGPDDPIQAVHHQSATQRC